MKKWFCLWLCLLMFSLPALAESPFAPYALQTPDQAELQENEGTYTFVSGNTRVVAMVIPRVPDDQPAEAVIRMMAQFEPLAIIGEDVPLTPGYVGLHAQTPDRFGKGVDQLNVMILGTDGALLILSGYDMDGNELRVEHLLDQLLSGLTANGQLLLTNE